MEWYVLNFRNDIRNYNDAASIWFMPCMRLLVIYQCHSISSSGHVVCCCLLSLKSPSHASLFKKVVASLSAWMVVAYLAGDTQQSASVLQSTHGVSSHRTGALLPAGPSGYNLDARRLKTPCYVEMHSHHIFIPYIILYRVFGKNVYPIFLE